jgi:small GTP-binding protein
MNHYKRRIKLVVLGDSCVGKSSLLTRYIHGKYYAYQPSTIGAAFMSKSVIVPENGDECMLEIWDTAGQERYRSLASMYYKGADIAIICYDITNINSYLATHTWIDELCSYTDIHLNGIVILCGTKSDLEEDRMVPYEDAEQYTKENGFYFMETSSKSGSNVDELFEYMTMKIPSIQKSNIRLNTAELSKDTETGVWGCCS